MPDNSKRTGAAIEAHYQFIAWLLPAVEKFPRRQVLTVGDRIAPTNAEPRDRQLFDTGGRELQFCRGTGHQTHLLDRYMRRCAPGFAVSVLLPFKSCFLTGK
jgi:hypothetical protein